MDESIEPDRTPNEPAPEPDRAGAGVLELEDLRATIGDGIRIAHGSLTLAHGDFELADAGDQRQAAAFSDLCSGLIEPAAGAVRFLGHDWQSLPHDYANALRGRIGRSFAEDAWVPHLSLLENILLQQQHHTRRTDEALLAEAADLAYAFGMPGVPVVRPGAVSPFDRARAALVRAFIGDPALVLLEHPLQGRYLDLLGPLVNVIAKARRRGAAVLWLTLTPAIWALRSMPITGRSRLSEGRLVRLSHSSVGRQAAP